MKQWKKHTIGKRILAWCLLVTMLFDTVTASAMNVNDDGNSQIELLEAVPEQEDTEEAAAEVEASEEMLEEAVSDTEDSEQTLEEMLQESEVSEMATEEPVALEDLKMTEQTFGLFKDVEIIFSGYSAYVKGTFLSNYPGEYYRISLVSYDSADEKLYEESLGMSSEESWTLEGWESWHVMQVAKDTSYVRLEASPLNSELGAGTVYSAKFLRTEKPDFSLTIEDMKTGIGTLEMSVAYTGELASSDEEAAYYLWAVFIGGTSDDENMWSEMAQTDFSIWENEKAKVCFANLEQGVTYYGKIQFYSKGYDQISETEYISYQQEIAVEPFTTKSLITYNLKTAFPDAVLRNWVIDRISMNTGYDYAEDSEVTNRELETITQLDLSYNDLSKEPVRDITGVELLTNVTEVHLENNEIDTATQTDWSKLTNLESLYLKGNNITQLPDLSKNVKLTYVDFDDNMLSKAELETVQNKLPVDTTYSTALFLSQRSSLIEIVLEETYYTSGLTVPFSAVLKGQKNYAARLLFDGVECNAAVVENGSIFVKDSGLAAGTHTVKVELYNGDEKVRETEAYTFKVAEKNTEYFCAYDEAVGKLEVVLSQQKLNQQISVVLRERPNEEYYPVIASGSAVVTGEVSFVELYQTDGTVFVPTLDVYYCEITVGEDTFTNWLCPSYYDEETYNYWKGSTVIQEGGRGKLYFYSDLAYSDYSGKNGKRVTAELIGEGVSFHDKRFSVGVQRWASNYTRFTVHPTMKGLRQGTYTLVLYKGEEVLASRELTICEQNKPVLESVTAEWISTSELKIYLTGDITNPVISLYDTEGQEIIPTRITTKKLSGNVGIMEATVTGLDDSVLHEGCYIKVLDYSKKYKDYVEPYRKNGELYYGSDNPYGEYITFENRAEVVCLKSEKRISGIGVTDVLRKNITRVPITIRICNAYNGEQVEEIIINRAQFRADSDKVYYYYCFNKGFWESLPEKDATYDIEVEADGVLLARFSGVIGYEKWYYSAEKTEFYLDSPSPKKAELTVVNASETPTFVSSNPEVAKLTPSTESSKTVTITAGKLGTSDITITADGYSRTFTVTVANLPKVKAQSSVDINSFFGDAKAELELTNSYGTAVTSVSIAETEPDEEGNTKYIGLYTEEIDGKWYLCWDGETSIKDKKITLKYEVEGFITTEEDSIAPQKVTVNVKRVTPETVLSPASVTFASYPYGEQYVDVSVKNSKDMFAIEPEDIMLLSAPEGVSIGDSEEMEDSEDIERTEGIGVTVAYEAETGRLLINADNNAVNGTYKFAILTCVDMENGLYAKPAVLTVNLKGTKPTFKFNTTSVTLDAAYPGESKADIKLLMDQGYVLEEAVIAAPNDSVNDFISVESKEDGIVTFKMEKAGLEKAGNYVITAKIRAPWGSVYEMPAIKVPVSVTNSSKVTLSSKSKIKSITVNPYVGSAEAKANLTMKGFTEQEGVEYKTSYKFIPTNELAKNASICFEVDENGTIKVSDCIGYEDGKYTYNIIGEIAGTDGTVTYSKPLVFTVQIQTKKLTIVPIKSSVTVYSKYCVINDHSYVVEIPVSVKELSEIELDMPLITSMEEKGVYARFNEDGTKVIVEFPTELTGVKNLNITPEDENSIFGTFKINITVKKSDAKAVFAEKRITLNRYLDTGIENTVADTEGYTIDSLTDITIMNKRKDNVTEQFVIDSDGNKVTISIADGCEDEIKNGDYTVSVVPMIDIGESDTKPLAECKFKLKLAQPTLKVSVGEAKKSSQTVNLYSKLDEVASESFELNVYCGDVKLDVSKIVIKNTNKDPKKIIAKECISDEGNIVHFEAVADEAGEYKNGQNTFSAEVYVKNVNGSKDIKAGKTLTKAFVVKVRDLPNSIALTKTALTYSPYLESSVSTTIKSAELAELMNTGDYKYVISVEETNSKYKALAEDKKNQILVVSGDENGAGVITVDNKDVPAKNATYYYKLMVDFVQKDTDIPIKSYTLKLRVSVKNTLPKAALQVNSISLDNAFVSQKVTNKVMLTTGTGFWTLDDLGLEDIVVKSGSKDITEKKYFDIRPDGTGFTISLNNRDVNGELMTVPKGTYKIVISPKITEKTEEMREALKSSLKAVTLTVKVASSRPTVKLATSVKVKAGDEAKILEPTLKNKGTITKLIIVDRTKPKNATEADLAGVEVKLLEDGTISVQAAENVLAGNYTFKIHPVTKIDGEDILLDLKTIKVTVQK